MIAGYSLYFKGTKTPTNFPEKIMNYNKITTIRRGYRWLHAFHNANLNEKELIIQHSIGVRTKAFYNFQSNVVKNVFKVKMMLSERHDFGLCIIIDYTLVSPEMLFGIEGFENVEAFVHWFKSDIKKNGNFEGSMIFWTDLDVRKLGKSTIGAEIDPKFLFNSHGN